MTIDHNRRPLIIASILRPEGTTGVHTHIREFRSYLNQRRIMHELVTPVSYARFAVEPVFALRLPLRYLAPPLSVAWYRYWHTAFLARALRQRLLRLGPAVIYAQGPEAAHAALQARTNRAQSVVMAVHFLGSQANGWIAKGHITPEGKVARSILSSERRSLGSLDAVLYVSSAARKHFHSSLPASLATKSYVIPNFISPIHPPNEPCTIGDLVTVGALENEKRHDFLLDVLHAAKALGHIYTLDIYGKGPLRARLQQRAATLGVASQVRFRGFQPAVRAMLPCYRAYVHACTTEAGPIAIVEAMAAGLPVFAPDCGGATELFTNGVEGYHLPAEDPRAAARALIAALDNPGSLAAAGYAAKERFARHFSTSQVAPRLLEVLLAASTTECDPPSTAQGPLAPLPPRRDLQLNQALTHIQSSIPPA